MYFEKNKRQKGKIQKGAYGENSRVRITQLTMQTEHLEAFEAIAQKTNSSKSYILEEMLKHSLLYEKIREEKIIRLKRVPLSNKRYIASHTISKNILMQIRKISKRYETTLSVVVWELLTLFFLSHPLYLQEEYLTN